MKKLLFLAIAYNLLYCGIIEKNYTKQEFEEVDNRSGAEIAQSIAEEESKNLPRKIDNLTKLKSAVAINTKIYFKKEFETTADEKLKDILSTEKGKKAFIKMQFEKRREELCDNKNKRNYIYKKDIGIQDDYYESNTKEYIGSVSVDKSDCIKMEEEKSKGKNTLY